MLVPGLKKLFAFSAGCKLRKHVSKCKLLSLQAPNLTNWENMSFNFWQAAAAQALMGVVMSSGRSRFTFSKSQSGRGSRLCPRDIVPLFKTIIVTYRPRSQIRNQHLPPLSVLAFRQAQKKVFCIFIWTQSDFPHEIVTESLQPVIMTPLPTHTHTHTYTNTL